MTLEINVRISKFQNNIKYKIQDKSIVYKNQLIHLNSSNVSNFSFY